MKHARREGSVKSLFIFDLLPIEKGFVLENSSVDLFPLTGDWRLISQVHSQMTKSSGNCRLLPSAESVDQALVLLRGRMNEWSYRLGEKIIAGKPLSKWFYRWGASSFVEKSPFKSDVFLKLSQLEAIKNQIQSESYDNCFISLGDKGLKKSLVQFLQERKINFLALTEFIPKKSVKKSLVEWLQLENILPCLLSAILWLGRTWAHGFYARWHLQAGHKKNKHDLLVISHFPLLDHKDLEKGRFTNKYMGPLQKKCSDWGLSLSWVLMPVPLQGIEFKEAVKIAQKIQAQGESLLFLDEFLTTGGLIRCFIQWVRQSLTAYKLLQKFPKDFLSEGLTDGSFEKLLEQYWIFSFLGYPGMSLATYLQVFENFSRRFERTKSVLYFSERQVWEKALETVSGERPDPFFTIAFQHTSFSRNFFPYFRDPHEREDDFPSPSLMACNGEEAKLALFSCAYKNLTQVEALRHFHLAKVLNEPLRDYKKDPSISFVSSYDRLETIRILQLLEKTFDKNSSAKIKTRLHPSLPFEKLLNEAGITNMKLFSNERDGTVETILESTSVVVAGRTSVAVDALLFGCRVILPIFPDVICSNPLAEEKGFYTVVSSPEDLKGKIADGLRNKITQSELNENRKLVRKFWDLDPDLKKWKSILLERR